MPRHSLPKAGLSLPLSENGREESNHPWSSGINLLLRRKATTMTSITSRNTCYTYGYGHLKSLFFTISQTRSANDFQSQRPDREGP